MSELKNNITLVYAYYENGLMLDRHMLEWAAYPDDCKPNLKAIIVDDGSPKDPAIKHIKPVGFSVELFRIKQDIPWNQNGARNLAMTHASGWCLLTDMDHLLPINMVDKLLNMELKSGVYYIPSRIRAFDGLPYHRHPNSYVMNRELYWKVGGYDEAYAGYYGTDATFRNQLAAKGGGRCELDDFYLILYGREVIPDASTTAYGRKGSEYYIPNNIALKIRKKLNPPPIPPLNFDWERVI